MVEGKPGIPVEDVRAELRGTMRAIRKLHPRQEDNFALNQISFLSNQLDQLFSAITLIGWIIGGFSILVGGFGIANIMFVSVKERTSQIGIQKALGAKNSFILGQFLTESVLLSLLGGLAGLLLVFGLTFLVSESAVGFTIFLSTKNIILGVSVSIIIGLVSGILPALSGSRMNPVDAIRYT
jgi:putative ABC transport system permease protein